MTAAPEPVLLGGELRYTLRVRNLGPGALPYVSVVAALPVGAPERPTVAIQEGPKGGRCRTEVASSARVVCVLPGMKRAETAAIVLSVQAQRLGMLAIRATASSRIADPRVSNNSVTVESFVREGFIRGSGSYSFVGDAGAVVFHLDAFGGNGHGRGTFSYRWTYRGQVLEASGHIVCLSLQGSSVHLKGVVDATNGLPIFEEGVDPTEQTGTTHVGDGAQFVVHDGAEGSVDTVFAHLPVEARSVQNCPVPQRGHGPWQALADGDFTLGLSPP